MESRPDVTLTSLRSASMRRRYFLHLLVRKDEPDLPTGPGGWIVPRAGFASGARRHRRDVA